MSEAMTQSDEFTSAMQQLSAEAAKSLPAAPNLVVENPEPGADETELHELSERVQSLEKTLADQFDQHDPAHSNQAGDFEQHFQRIEDHLAAIRSKESVNQKLFDSLHAELRKYRDDFLHETLQKPFIHDLLHLYDDLCCLGDELRTAAQEKGKRVAQWYDNLENAIHSLVEILHRFEVTEIEAEDRVNLAYHRVISYERADRPEEDGRIVTRLKRGFIWRGKLIRPEEVIAKRYS
jgi:molecular chaperone GrpE (heat shock protein)